MCYVMTFDLVVTLVSSVFLVLVTIDRQHDANRVLYVKAVWPRAFSGNQAWTSTISTKHALLAFSKYNKMVDSMITNIEDHPKYILGQINTQLRTKKWRRFSKIGIVKVCIKRDGRMVIGCSTL